MAEASDLGRRVGHQRRQLQLSVEQLAERTGMAVPYLEHIESSPTAMPDAQTVMKLATALETTTAYLLGTDRAPGGRHAGGAPVMVALDQVECWDLVAGGGVGRLVFDSERGPTALPVNFRVFDREVVFRTEPGSHFDQLDGAERVGLEVDHIDDAFSQGWSVLVTGTVRPPADDAELDRVQHLDVSPWAGGEKEHYRILESCQITGRRISTQ